jgi:spermidine/putrescine transport system permease protein
VSVISSKTTQRTTPARARRKFEVGKLPGFGIWTFLVFTYLYAPLLVLVIFSFNNSRTVTIWSGFSLSWYQRVFASEGIRRAAVTSLTVASIATTVATIIATLAALALVRGGAFRGKRVVMATLMSPLMVPEIVTAVATLALFATLSVSLGVGKVILAHCVFCIPFAYLPIQARLQSMDTTLEQAARDLYANDWRTFRRITLPLMVPGIISGAMLAFIISMDDFIITLFIAEAGTTTLPLYIYGMVRTGVTPEVNAISSIVLAISIVFVVSSLLIGRHNA